MISSLFQQTVIGTMYENEKLHVGNRDTGNNGDAKMFRITSTTTLPKMILTICLSIL